MPLYEDLANRSRKIFMITTFSCFFIVSVQRINVRLVIVSMANWTAINGSKEDACYEDNNLSAEDGNFLWSIREQTQILSSYFLGLSLSIFPAEIFAERISPVWIAFSGVLVASICNLVTPVSASWSIYAMMILQGLIGVAHGVITPSFSVMMGRWVIVNRLVSFMAYTTCAFPFGAFLATILSGVICDYNPGFGWRIAFYISGGIGIFWCIAWLYLKKDFGFTLFLTYYSHCRGVMKMERQPIPWRLILFSYPTWAYVAVGIAVYWSFSLILMIPLYVKTVYKLDIAWNGVVSSFPSLFQACTYLIAIIMSERALQKKTAKKKSIRTGFICMGLGTFATCSVVLAYSTCSRAFGVFLLLISVGAYGFAIAHLAFIPVDMSPQFSGAVSGLMNSIGALVGAVFPIIAGYIVKEKNVNSIEWEKVLFASSFINVVGMILFMAFGSCQLQHWGNEDEKDRRRQDLTEGSAEQIKTTTSDVTLNSKNNGSSQSVTDSKILKAQESTSESNLNSQNCSSKRKVSFA